jgi:hypothetical protein
LRAGSRPHDLNGTFRRARSREEEQVSSADAKIPKITDRLEGFNDPFGRSTLARQEVVGRNQDHGQTVGANRSAAICDD